MRRLAGMLLFCALLLRGMIPGGFMPDFNAADGQGFLVICSGIGDRLLPVAGDDAAPADTHQDGLCAFASLGAVGPALALVVLLFWPSPSRVRFALPNIRLDVRRWSCAPLGARAPPVFA